MLRTPSRPLRRLCTPSWQQAVCDAPHRAALLAANGWACMQAGAAERSQVGMIRLRRSATSQPGLLVPSSLQHNTRPLATSNRTLACECSWRLQVCFGQREARMCAAGKKIQKCSGAKVKTALTAQAQPGAARLSGAQGPDAHCAGGGWC